MPSPGYDPSRTEGTPEPTLPNPPELPVIKLVLPSPSSRKMILSYFSGQQTARILTQLRPFRI